MGLMDILFGKDVPKVTSILPEAAVQEIRAGRLPQLNTDTVFLRRGEICHYIDKAVLLIYRTKKIYRHVGMSTPGLFKGERMNFGGGDTKEVRQRDEYGAILYITNQRVILQCRDHGFDRPHSQLTAAKPYTNALELQYGSQTSLLIVPDGTVPDAVLRILKSV